MWYHVKDNTALAKIWFAFLPSWFNRNYGVTFGERYTLDPDYRTETLMYMAVKVAERFPGLHIGSKDPRPDVTLPDFNNTSTPALAGCEVFYSDDNYPWNRHLSPEQIARLEPPNARLLDLFPYSEILRQVKHLNAKLGKDCMPVLPVRGVLNDAILIQGSAFLEDYLADPQRAAKLLDYTFSVLMAVVRTNQELGHRDMVTLCNCTAIMLGPNMYDAGFHQFDSQAHTLAVNSGNRFGIHHCGLIDTYLPGYRKLPRVDSLAIGWGSDIKLALDTFPEAQIQCLFSPTFLASATRQQVRDKILEMLDRAKGNLSRIILEVSDIEHGTPEENLYEIYECCKNATL